MHQASRSLRRYVHGPGVDEPLLWYEGGTLAATSLRRLRANWQGSVVAVTNSPGTPIAINRYDDYGIPDPGNLGRFQYTGQAWIVELGMYHYKARIYSPTLGRFLQTDPIGYEDQINLYAYVANDPVNRVDPSGNQAIPIPVPLCVGPQVVGCVVAGGAILCSASSPCRDAVVTTVKAAVDGIKALGSILRSEGSQPTRPSDGTPARDGAEPQRVGKKASRYLYETRRRRSGKRGLRRER